MNFLNIIFFIFLVGIFLFFSEFLKLKFSGINKEFLRKIPHIFIGIIFAVLPYFLNKEEIIFLAFILTLGVILNKFVKVFSAIFDIERFSVGVFLTPISLGISAWYFLPQYPMAFSVGFLVLAFSDSFASMVGKLFQSKKIISNISEKTYLGSFSCFIITFGIFFAGSLLKGDIFFVKVFLFSFMITVVEFFIIFGFDNIAIPFVSAYLFTLI